MLLCLDLTSLSTSRADSLRLPRFRVVKLLSALAGPRFYVRRSKQYNNQQQVHAARQGEDKLEKEEERYSLILS